MREIKFRARDKRGKSFVYFTVKLGKEVFLAPDEYSEELCLFTGLKDKNDKETYFADLVQWGKAVYKVVWNEDEGIAALQYVKGKEVFKYLSIHNIRNGEVIGNIYENPELIKEQQ